ncbi:Uma2 family endonuclease [Pseudanabaena sp. FACHB-1998]|uniref:Uma2 family endonuclease n=1 Tax=Pseudanabaena sp. FACHB-1998 TaxID=2692858 RepID=UPI001680ADE3|nr:Uma2 family endonuclease [Pseudanabaena sp. FACHB-1998]MBD2176337.1 Uma2 family endonuclease [Pseudanabaena sp. FACHB-1998]
MPVKIAIAQIQLEQGQRVSLENISWQEFVDILEDLGEHRHSLIAYYKGVLELRMPLAGHERIKVLIGDLLKIILDELALEWESLGSTTFKNKKMQAGIEPDDCFYINNYQAVIGKKRIDLTVDPAPDLVIEVDLTSITQINAYEALAVSEIWRYKNGKLEINLLANSQYVNSTVSKALPNIDVIQGISLFLEKSNEIPMSTLRREFRQWLQEQIK